MMPAVDDSGKIIMKSKGEISLAPNGNGGVFAAIKASKEAYEVIKGTDYVQFLSVDNVLNAVLDPLQIGHAID